MAVYPDNSLLVVLVCVCALICARVMLLSKIDKVRERESEMQTNVYTENTKDASCLNHSNIW